MDIEILCRASISVHGKAFPCVPKKRTTKCLYRAIIYRAAFAMRFQEKRMAKPLPCALLPLSCAADARQSL
jgi:hypothetical protein